MAVNPLTNKIYVGSFSDNSLTLIDGATQSASNFPVGLGPVSIAVNQITNKTYVANYRSNSVTVIDNAINSVSTMIAGAGPCSIAVNSATNKIYVANAKSNNVTVIDGLTNTTSTVPVGIGPDYIAVNPVTNKIYVANANSNDVTVIDGFTNATSTVTAGTGPDSIAVNPVTNKIYVANANSNNVTVMDGLTNATSIVTAGTGPNSIAVNPVTNKIYVANVDSNNVTVIDGTTSSTSTVGAGTGPCSISVNTVTNKIYVANNLSNNVTVIDGATNITFTSAASSNPKVIIVNPANGKVYVANLNNELTVYSNNLTARTTVPLAANSQPSFTLSATSAAVDNTYPAAYFSFGDSITAGLGASSTSNRYTNVIASDLSVALSNRGVSGAQACDTAQTIMSFYNPPESKAPIETIMIGVNDAKKGAGLYESVYESCHTASLAWLAIPSTQKTSAQSCTQSGTWTADTTYAQGLALKSSAYGSALSCPVVSYGGPLYLWYRVTDSNGGIFSYSVDGGPSQSVNAFSATSIATQNGGVDGVFMIRVAGIAAGSHTIKVTVSSATSSSNNVSILAVGSLNPVAQYGAPKVFVGGVIREQNDLIASATATYDADAAADVSLLNGDGLPVYFVPVRNFVNATTDMADQWHPNDLGHRHLRDAFESLNQFSPYFAETFDSKVTVNPVNGFSSAVTLVASGWPVGITGIFGTNPATATSTVDINVAPSVAPGPYLLTVNGMSGSLSENTTIPITVATPPSFTLSATAALVDVGSTGTSTVTLTSAGGFHSGVTLSVSGWPAGITATFGTDALTTSLIVNISVTASVKPGSYSLPVNGVAGPFSASTNIILTVSTPSSVKGSAAFTGLDTTTQGAWSTKYGADGDFIANNAANSPTYANVNLSGSSLWTWVTPTSDPRALTTSGGGIASTYYGSTFTIDVKITDGNMHQVSLYLLDWDTTSRVETISILDARSSAVLDTETFANLHNGYYASWNISGEVIIRITDTSGINAVVSGIFFGSAPVVPSSQSSAIYKGLDAVTQGNWTAKYGADGYFVANSAANEPAYANIGFTNSSLWTWANPTSDPRALTTSGGGGIASTYYGSTFTIDVKINDGNAHQLSLYLLDWDTTSRVETISILDGASRAILDTETFAGFHSGSYASWKVSGHVIIQFTANAGINAVVSAIFFDSGSIASPPDASATYSGLDTTTLGTWTGKYGTSGYLIANDVNNLPSYTSATVSGNGTWTWTSATSDVRGLQITSGSSTFLASTYYSNNGSFSINLNLTDGRAHRISLYLLDWDTTSRAETIAISGAASHDLLSVQSFSDFHNGEYASWNVTGSVVIQFTSMAGINAVVSGIFVD